MPSWPVNRIVLYVHHMEKVACFYEQHFDFVRSAGSLPDSKIVLEPAKGGAGLVILRAAKSQKAGQSLVKIVFDVDDVEAAKKTLAKGGLRFGPTHHGPGYEFANARDPAKNLIQLSNAWRVTRQ